MTFTGLTGTINQSLWEQLPDGHVTIIFYAKDLSENIGSKGITIVLELEEILIYNTMILIGLIGLITIVLLKDKFKQIKTLSK